MALRLLEAADLDVPAGAATPPGPAVPSRIKTFGANLAWGLLGFVAFIVLWQLGASRVPQLPDPVETSTKLRDMLSEPFYNRGPNDKGIGLRMYTSLQRVFYGFGLAMMVGIPLGFAIGASRRAWQAFNPLIQVLRPVSPLAWFPILLVIVRDASQAAIWVIFVTSLWPTVLNTAAGAAAVPSDQRAVARVFRFGKVPYLRHVLVPNTLPAIVTGMRVSMGIAWMVIVAVEMLAAGGGTGIGSYVWEQYNALNLTAMIAAIVLIGVTGYLLDLIFLRLGRAVAIEEPAP
ncbi:MAG: ABC transporter permease subunit [Acidimicrobiales bacterium]|nr:ABC transporter permease subunit [Acidimicrobiales bacterium]